MRWDGIFFVTLWNLYMVGCGVASGMQLVGFVGEVILDDLRLVAAQEVYLSPNET